VPLAELDRDVWTIDHPLRAGGLALGTRTSLVRLPDGGIWLLSPGPLDAPARERIAKLGPVRAIVLPNLLHHLYAADAAAAFPEARVYAVPGIEAKQPKLRIDERLGDEPPAPWRGALEQVALGGVPRMGEVVFFHPRSKTLFLTDLAFNLHPKDAVTRLFMRLNGGLDRFGPTRIFRFAVLRDRAALRASLERVLRWDFERVVVTHGEIVPRGGRELLRSAFAWV
jgi:glyoxylase-like metal-dependent hydrolase (beta-lactamase superfamily II)